MSSGSPTLPSGIVAIKGLITDSGSAATISVLVIPGGTDLHGYYHSQVLLPETLSIHLQQISMQDIHIRMVAHKYSP